MAEEIEAMTHDRPDAPTKGSTYNGFAGPPRDGEPTLRFDGRPPPAPRRSRKPLILAGVAGALGLGVLVGLMARPQLVTDRETRPMAPVATASTGEMEIAVAPELPPPAPPAPVDDAPLEVLPPEYASAAQARAAEASARAPVIVPSAPTPAVVTPPPRVEAAPPVVAVAPPPPRRTERPSFNCAYAGTRAERMVCDDPELAAADRRLARAFRQATESGVPYRALRAEQDDWLAIREDAARRSPAAVASVYEQRIEELNAMARGEY